MTCFIPFWIEHRKLAIHSDIVLYKIEIDHQNLECTVGTPITHIVTRELKIKRRDKGRRGQDN